MYVDFMTLSIDVDLTRMCRTDVWLTSIRGPLLSVTWIILRAALKP